MQIADFRLVTELFLPFPPLRTNQGMEFNFFGQAPTRLATSHPHEFQGRTSK